MTAQVLRFKGITTQTHGADQILDAAGEQELDECVVIGRREDGSFYFASTHSDGGVVLWLLERAKHKLMTITDDLEDE